jgi:hypothetical protein
MTVKRVEVRNFWTLVTRGSCSFSLLSILPPSTLLLLLLLLLLLKLLKLLLQLLQLLFLLL